MTPRAAAIAGIIVAIGIVVFIIGRLIMNNKKERQDYMPPGRGFRDEQGLESPALKGLQDFWGDDSLYDRHPL
jgi:hypothetical protein